MLSNAIDFRNRRGRKPTREQQQQQQQQHPLYQQQHFDIFGVENVNSSRRPKSAEYEDRVNENPAGK